MFGASQWGSSPNGEAFPVPERGGLCRARPQLRKSRQPQKRERSSTRNQFKFDAFTHLSLLIYPKTKVAPEDHCLPIGLRANVRFGSKADVCVAKPHVRFTPDSDRKSGLPQKAMSASPPKADACAATSDVGFGPIADIARKSQSIFLRWYTTLYRVGA